MGGRPLDVTWADMVTWWYGDMVIWRTLSDMSFLASHKAFNKEKKNSRLSNQACVSALGLMNVTKQKSPEMNPWSHLTVVTGPARPSNTLFRPGPTQNSGQAEPGLEIPALLQIQSQHFAVFSLSSEWTAAYLPNTILERVSKLSAVKSYETY